MVTYLIVMKKILKPIVIDSLSLVNTFPTALTSKEKIKSFMQKLKPKLPSGMNLVRIGPMGDGGYLVPDDLMNIEACFSPGVSSISGFEKECADRGIKVFMADKSVDGPAETHVLFHFTKKFIGATSTNEFITMDDWVKDSLPLSDADLLLQIDIEGYEYETFICMSDLLIKKFRIIVAEFHFLDKFWSDSFFFLASRAFDKILQTHTCVHIHPNNSLSPITINGLVIPPTMEFTFLRNDRFESTIACKEFPHPLDIDSTDSQHLPLPGCWYEGML